MLLEKNQRVHILKEKVISWLLKKYEQLKKWCKKQKAGYKAAHWYGKIFRIILSLIILFFLFLFCVDINFLWLFGKSPSMLSISEPQQSTASEIYSADGKLIGKYFRENRTPVKYDEIAPIIIK